MRVCSGDQNICKFQVMSSGPSYFRDMKIIAFDKHFTREKEQEVFMIKATSSIARKDSQKRAFELGLEDILCFTSHSTQRKLSDQRLAGVKDTLKLGDCL